MKLHVFIVYTLSFISSLVKLFIEEIKNAKLGIFENVLITLFSSVYFISKVKITFCTLSV